MRTALLPALLAPALLHAQEGPPVRAELPERAIVVGAQVPLRLVAPVGVAAWPVIGDTLNNKVEVVRRSAPDTIANGTVIEQVLHITSFDTGYWAVPPFRFTLDGKPVETEPLLLQVNAYPVDSAAVPKDIRPIAELPFSLLWWMRAHAQWIAGTAIAASLIAALLLLLQRLRRKKPVPVATEAPRPLHERILAELEQLDRERLWQQGQHKAYQSRLTDLLRAYIEERYQVPALERTTDELLAELRVSPVSTEQQALLANMLRHADLVKFAKALPGPQENEQLMAGAKRFVNETAQRTPPHAQTPAG